MNNWHHLPGVLAPWDDCQGHWELQLFHAAAAKSLQLCLTLCDPTDGSPPGSPVPGILKARTPEWVAISFSNAWKWKVKVKLLSRVRLLATPQTVAHQAPLSTGKNTGVGSLSLLQQTFPTQESNQGLLHCRRILCQLSYEGYGEKLPGIARKGSKRKHTKGRQLLVTHI